MTHKGALTRRLQVSDSTRASGNQCQALLVEEMREVINQLRQRVSELERENERLRLSGSSQPMPSLSADWLEEDFNEKQTVLAITPPSQLRQPAPFSKKTAMLSPDDLDFCLGTKGLIADSTPLEHDTEAVDAPPIQVLKRAKPRHPGATFDSLLGLEFPPQEITRHHRMPDGFIILNAHGSVLHYQQRAPAEGALHQPIIGEPFFESAPYEAIRLLKPQFKLLVRLAHRQLLRYHIIYRDAGALRRMVFQMTQGRKAGHFALKISRRD